jgi:hypothetical protein
MSNSAGPLLHISPERQQRSVTAKQYCYQMVAEPVQGGLDSSITNWSGQSVKPLLLRSTELQLDSTLVPVTRMKMGK